MPNSIELLFPNQKTRCVTFSFDDGVLQDERLIAMFNARGLKGTFNINSGFMGQNDDMNRNGRVIGHRHVTCERMRDVYAGQELAVHMVHHPWPTRIPDVLLLDEVLQDKRAIEAITGAPVRGMAYPFGDYNAHVIELLRACGIAYSRTTVTTADFKLPAEPLAWATSCHYRGMGELVEKFNLPGGDVRAFTIWGHAYECDIFEDWEALAANLDAVAGQDDVWYCTNIELFDYIAAYRALNWSAAGELVQNPSALSVCLRVGVAGKVRECEIASGATVCL